MNAPGTLRRVLIRAVYSGVVTFEWGGQSWVVGGNLAALLQGARPGQYWLIRWYQPQGQDARITEAQRCER